MASIANSNLIVRYIANRKRDGKWFGICLNFDISAEAETPGSLKAKLKSMIIDYIEAILDTDDQESVVALLQRRAPLRYWLDYWVMSPAVYIYKFKTKLVFNQRMRLLQN